MKRLYVDTSAYLCLLLGEDGWEDISAATEGSTLLSSVLLILETKRSLVRLARDGAITADDYKKCLQRVDTDTGRFVLRDLTIELCSLNLLPAIVTPRSLDLAHLRTALWFHAGETIERFVTMDRAQRHAAQELGLPV